MIMCGRPDGRLFCAFFTPENRASRVCLIPGLHSELKNTIKSGIIINHKGESIMSKLIRISLTRGFAALIIIGLILGQCVTMPVYAADSGDDYEAFSNSVDKAIEKVKKAQKKLDEAEKEYNAFMKANDSSVSDEEMAEFGWDFLDKLVKESYEKDKDKVSESNLVPLKKLTVRGNINRALTVTRCKNAIKRYNASSDKSKRFEPMLKRSLSIKNIKRAIEIVEKCNYYRRINGKKALKISPYLMAGAAVCALTTHKAGGYHAYVKSGKFRTFDGTIIRENYAWGYSDPFYGWYTVERRRRANGGGWPHLRQILSSSYKQTGASWNDSCNLANQVFTSSSKGKSYTVSEFRELFDEYVKARKKEIRDEKKAILSGKKKPDYLVEAEEAMAKAQEKLKKAYKSYKPEIKVLKTVTDSKYYATVKYKIPDKFTGVRIYRTGTGEGGKYTRLKSLVKGTSLNDRTVRIGGNYYYKIRLFRVYKGKYYFSDYSYTIHIKESLGRVSGLKAVYDDSTGELVLDWADVRAADGYEIHIKESGNDSYLLLGTESGPEGFVLAAEEDGEDSDAALEVSAEGTYKIKVRAYTVINGKKKYGTFSTPVTLDFIDEEGEEERDEGEGDK